MKIATVQLDYIIADVLPNAEKAIQAIRSVQHSNPDIVVLTEMLTTGYPPKDLLYRKDLIDLNLQARDKIVALTSEIKSAVVFGYVENNPVKGGKPYLNSGCIAKDGKIIKLRRKTLLPTYDVFAEDRYFEPLISPGEFDPVEIAGRKVALLICEETWNADKSLYSHDPVEESVKAGADYLVVINASPYRRGVVDQRHALMSNHCITHRVEAVYVNQVGFNDNVGFDGDSFAMNTSGQIVFHAPMWREDISIFDTDSTEVPEIAWEREWQEEVICGLTVGIRDYFDKNGIKGPAIVCNSGGIDSALVLYLAIRAMGFGRVISIAMPSEFSSEHSLTDAKKLADGMGVQHLVIPIKSIHHQMRKRIDIGNTDLRVGTWDIFGVENKPTEDSGVTDENIQARIRGMIGMAYANRFSGLVLSTGNKSEMATGYCTMYGDMCGGLAVISDLFKTDIYKLCPWINETYKEEIIPKNTINKAPSAELRPGQFDQQSLPPYELVDDVLRRYVEQHISPRDIKEELITDQAIMEYLSKTGRMLEKDIEKVILLTINSEYKRQQAPTGLKMSNKLFKCGWDMPIAHRLRL